MWGWASARGWPVTLTVLAGDAHSAAGAQNVGPVPASHPSARQKYTLTRGGRAARTQLSVFSVTPAAPAASWDATFPTSGAPRWPPPPPISAIREGYI